MSDRIVTPMMDHLFFTRNLLTQHVANPRARIRDENGFILKPVRPIGLIHVAASPKLSGLNNTYGHSTLVIEITRSPMPKPTNVVQWRPRRLTLSHPARSPR